MPYVFRNEPRGGVVPVGYEYYLIGIQVDFLDYSYSFL